MWYNHLHRIKSSPFVRTYNHTGNNNVVDLTICSVNKYKTHISLVWRGSFFSVLQVTGGTMNGIELDQRDDFLDRQVRLRDETPFIYICATMWHETKSEMIQMLKSIFK